MGRGRHDGARDLPLNREHLGEVPLEALGPQMVAGRRVDQLRRDAQPTALLAHAALHDERDVERVPDRADVQILRAKAK